MTRTMLQAKLHRVSVTATELDYEGSCAIDRALLEASGILPYQYIEIYNVSNGERFATYAMPSHRGSGEIALNGAAARKAAIGDHLIICAYATFNNSELEKHEPVVIFVGESNQVKS